MMTQDQIEHLRDWLAKHESFKLVIEQLQNRSFLSISKIGQDGDDKEMFYIPLSQKNIQREIH